MKNTNIIKVLMVTVVAFLYACGGADSQTAEETASAESPEAVSAGPVDTKAKSDSKGIGKFTSVEIKDLDPAMAVRGEAIFTSKCSACHKVTADKVVGPGLLGLTERRTPEWIMNMITNPEEMTKQDPVAKALFEEHLIQMTFQDVSDEETREILEYFRQIDSK